MKLIARGEIKRAIRDVSPTNIAVAYVGADWKEYIDPSVLKEVVLSPTIGSNPYAIAKLAKQLGWENVHFLDQLHSKVYLGETAAAVGSFNLTANGLSAEGLEEAGFFVKDPTTLAELRMLVATYVKQASLQYPTADSKLKQLARLRETWDRASTNDIIRNDAETTEFSQYLSTASDEIYVCPAWGSCAPTGEVVSQSTINQSIAFLATDEVLASRWLLYWPARRDGYPSERGMPGWMHVDEVIENGADDSVYTKLAVERSRTRELLPPFELSKPVVEALYAVLRSGKFPAFLRYDDSWSLDLTLPRLQDFFEAVRQELLRPEKAVISTAFPNAELRQAFAERVRAAMDIAVGEGFVTSAIERLLEKQHAVEVAKKLIVSPDLKPGLIKLAKAGRLDLSFERMMLEPRFEPLFSKPERDCAEFNLREASLESDEPG